MRLRILSLLAPLLALAAAAALPRPGFHVPPDTAKLLDVQYNDAVTTGLAVTSAPSDGTAVVSGTSILYTPDPGFAGADSFEYSNDGGGPFQVNVWVGYRYLIPPRGVHTTDQGQESFVVISPFAQTPLRAASGTVYFNGGAAVAGGAEQAFAIADPVADPSVEMAIDTQVDLMTFPRPLISDMSATVESGRGIIVDSTEEVTVLISQRITFHQSSLTAKGADGRGTEFIAVQMYNEGVYQNHYPSTSPDRSNFVSVIASEPNTVATINLPQYHHVEGAGGELAQQRFVAGTTVQWDGLAVNTPMTCNLVNIGDSCTVMARPTDAQVNADVSGAIVTADKPVSVASGTTDGIISDCGDHGWDQLVPVEYIGQYYILIRGEGVYMSEDFETAIIIPQQDDTNVWFDDTPFATPDIALLDRGQPFFVRPVGAAVGDTLYIRADKPIVVAQSSANNICETGISIIPPYLLTEAHEARFRTPLLGDMAGSSVSIVTTTFALGTLNIRCLSCNGGAGADVNWQTSAVATSAAVVGRPALSVVRVGGNAALDATLEPTEEILGEEEYLITSDGLTQVGVTFGTGPGGGFGYVTDYSPAALDTDMDGIPDVIDIDVDNDGIRDDLEFQQSSIGFFLPPPFSDADFDGTPNFEDPDVPNCNFVSGVCTAYDTDGDGVPNHKDLDSDNDGVPDLVEGATDPLIWDLDNDWQIDLTNEFGVNGLADGLETAPDSDEPLLNPAQDTDSDGVIDMLDLDSDNDGMSDLYESRTWNPSSVDALGDGLMDIGSPVDADSDGIDAAYDGDDSVRGQFGVTVVRDHDGDSVPDVRDLDSDNDGILDIIEFDVVAFQLRDIDGDGSIDQTADADLDGIDDSLDTDTGATGSPGLYAVTVRNKDTASGDIWEDYIDLDADQDGLGDLFESGYFTIAELYAFADTNEDGVLDGVDADGDGIRSEMDTDDSTWGSPAHPLPVDSDLDGDEDFRDWDSDNDGDPDLRDIGERDLAIWDPDGDDMLDGTPDVDEDGIYDGTTPPMIMDMIVPGYGGIFLPRRFEILEPLAGTTWWMYRTGHVVFRTNLLSAQYTHVRLRLYSDQDPSTTADDILCEAFLDDVGNIPLVNDFNPIRVEWIQPGNGQKGAHHCFTGPAYITAAPNGPLGEDEEFRVSDTFFLDVRATEQGI